MKKLIFLLFILIGVTLKATTYYVRTDGVDDAGRDGLTTGTAWATPSYASSRISAGDHIIYINSGTYTDNNRINLALGVDLLGNSTTRPEITTSYVAANEYDGYIYAVSSSGNAVDGSHNISYININGNATTATRLGTIRFRSNVKVHHCTFTNFLYSGIDFFGTNQNWDVTPTNTLPTGNEVYDCTFDNLSQRVGQNWGGHIRSEGQNGMLIHNNSFAQNTRTASYNGNTFSGYQNYGLQVYNNSFAKPDNTYPEWNFFMEFHYSHGGIDIYNNDFVGAAAIDFSGVDKGAYSYGGRIYDNTFTSASGSLPPYNAHNEPYLDFESFDVENDLYVFRNRFDYCRLAITLGNDQTSSSNIWIYDNIFDHIGNSDNDWSNGLYIHSDWNDSSPILMSNVYIYHNVIRAGKTCTSGINFQVRGNMTNINVRNNIITGSFGNPIVFTSPVTPTVTTLNINNNIFYDNSSTSISYDTDITYNSRDDSGNLAGSSYNPSFVGGTPYSFELSSTASPAYHTGYNVDVDTDFLGNTFHATTPSIGAYEIPDETPPQNDNHGALFKNGKYLSKKYMLRK